LYVAAPLLAESFAAEKRDAQSDVVIEPNVQLCDRVKELHEAMLFRARKAIVCWSAVGVRLGVVKDVRVMIAKMAWEPWRWHEKAEK
jgi:hypothetical protein